MNAALMNLAETYRQIAALGERPIWISLVPEAEAQNERPRHSGQRSQDHHADPEIAGVMLDRPQHRRPDETAEVAD